MKNRRATISIQTSASPRLAAHLLAASLLFASPMAIAQQGDKAAAEALFQAGIALMNEGKFTEACPKLLESQRADPSSGTLLNLASCYEKVGKTASAWATFKEAATLARSLGQTDREATANTRIASLEPALSMLRIDAADTPGLVIKRDGLAIGRASLGVPVPIDPGEHTLTAGAPGYEDWKMIVLIGANADSKAVVVPLLQKKEERAAAPASEEGAPDKGQSLRIAGFVVGGAGLAGIGVGAILGGMAVQDKVNADVLCPNKLCSDEGRDYVEASTTKAIGATIAIGVGAAALGTGAILLLVSRSSNTGEEPKASASRVPAVHIIPSFGPEGASMSLRGRF